jgi:hypothetical protein
MEDPPPVFDEMMLRGERLRLLRLLEKEDEEERQRQKQEEERLKQQKQKQKQKQQQQQKRKAKFRQQKQNEIIITATATASPSPSFVSEEKVEEEENVVLLSSSLPLSLITDKHNRHFSTKHLSESDLTKITTTTDISGDDSDYDDEYFTIEEEDENNDADSEADTDIVEGEDKIDILPDSKLMILRYDSFLNHQRYNDGYKHANCHFVDFGVVQSHIKGESDDFHHLSNLGPGHNRLIIEQERSLGKGGLIWDAGVILADHLIATQNKWMDTTTTGTATTNDVTDKSTRIVELGAGTGVTGLMIAKAVQNSYVYITDLPDVIRLMARNVIRNFGVDSIITTTDSSLPSSSSSSLEDRVTLTDYDIQTMDRGDAAQDIPTMKLKSLPASSSPSPIQSLHLSNNDKQVMYDNNAVNTQNDTDTDSFTYAKQSNGNVTAKVLRWGMEEDYKDGPFDVVIAGDVVTSLYDPKALAKTIYDLCHDESIVYVSSNLRRDEEYLLFEDSMKKLFHSVSFEMPITRHWNTGTVTIMRASGLKR